MRLIDADKLLELIKEQKEREIGGYTKGINAGLNIAKSIINDETQTPTAYDVDKVVEQLEEFKKAEQNRPDNCDENGFGDGEQIYDDGRSQGRCEAFNKEHPNWDLSFEYGTCSEADAGKTVTQDVSASADVYMFANYQLQTQIDANAISELGGSTADYVKSTNSQAVVDSITADGGIYGVPFTTNTWFLYYNKKVYSESDVKSLDTMLEKGKVAFPLTNGWYNAAFYLANGCTLFGDGTDNKLTHHLMYQ